MGFSMFEWVMIKSDHDFRTSPECREVFYKLTDCVKMKVGCRSELGSILDYDNHQYSRTKLIVMIVLKAFTANSRFLKKKSSIM